MNSSSAKSQLEKGFDEIMASDTSGPSLRSPGVSAQWHHFPNPFQTVSFTAGNKKTFCFLLIKGNASKKQGITPWLEGLGFGIR